MSQATTSLSNAARKPFSPPAASQSAPRSAVAGSPALSARAVRASSMHIESLEDAQRALCGATSGNEAIARRNMDQAMDTSWGITKWVKKFFSSLTRFGRVGRAIIEDQKFENSEFVKLASRVVSLQTQLGYLDRVSLAHNNIDKAARLGVQIEELEETLENDRESLIKMVRKAVSSAENPEATKYLLQAAKTILVSRKVFKRNIPAGEERTCELFHEMQRAAMQKMVSTFMKMPPEHMSEDKFRRFVNSLAEMTGKDQEAIIWSLKAGRNPITGALILSPLQRENQMRKIHQHLESLRQGVQQAEDAEGKKLTVAANQVRTAQTEYEKLLQVYPQMLGAYQAAQEKFMSLMQQDLGRQAIAKLLLNNKYGIEQLPEFVALQNSADVACSARAKALLEAREEVRKCQAEFEKTRDQLNKSVEALVKAAGKPLKKFSGDEVIQQGEGGAQVFRFAGDARGVGEEVTLAILGLPAAEHEKLEGQKQKVLSEMQAKVEKEAQFFHFLLSILTPGLELRAPGAAAAAPASLPYLGGAAADPRQATAVSSVDY